MKKIISVLVLVICASAFAQDKSAKVSGSMYINPARSKDKPLGSPYMQFAFANAKLANIKVDAYMRYNVFADEFEFITPKNDTLVLDKTEDFNNIFFMGLNKKYELVQYTNKKKLVYGYLIRQYEKGDFVLYRKENISFTEAKIAKTTLERDMPAKYNKLSDTYFLKNKEAGITEFPDGKKALLKLFPDKKQVIEDFLKANKIDFENEKDLIQIVNLIAAP